MSIAAGCLPPCLVMDVLLPRIQDAHLDAPTQSGLLLLLAAAIRSGVGWDGEPSM
jgi:hypothetical protein